MLLVKEHALGERAQTWGATLCVVGGMALCPCALSAAYFLPRGRAALGGAGSAVRSCIKNVVLCRTFFIAPPAGKVRCGDMAFLSRVPAERCLSPLRFEQYPSEAHGVHTVDHTPEPRFRGCENISVVKHGYAACRQGVSCQQAAQPAPSPGAGHLCWLCGAAGRTCLPAPSR